MIAGLKKALSRKICVVSSKKVNPFSNTAKSWPVPFRMPLAKLSVSAPGDTLQAVRHHEFADPFEAPGDADITVHVDFEALSHAVRAGGAERQQYTLGEDSPFPGALIENDGRFEDIVPDERIVLTSSSTFAGNRISTALITYELADDGDGTKLTLTHQAAFYEGSDGPEMRRDGWQVLLDTLGRTLVS